MSYPELNMFQQIYLWSRENGLNLWEKTFHV